MTQVQEPQGRQEAPAPAWPGLQASQFVNGEWREGRGAGTIVDRDPYTGRTLLEIRQSDASDLDDAYRAAERAQSSWAAALPGERAAVIRRAAAIVEQRRDQVLDWLIRESGSTRIKADLEVQSFLAVLNEAASHPYRAAGAVLPGDVPGKECRTYRKPVGVVGLVTPWNWPLHLTARTLFPAIAVGNAVVIKPSSDTPVTGGLLLARILEEAGLPAGVVNVIVAGGAGIGDAFASHDVPRLLSFTGSTAVGRRIGRLAMEAPLMKRLELELGGNTPFVVLDDADLEAAVEAGVFGKFLHSGQICMAVNRFIVDDAVFDEFVDRFAERARTVKYGDPSDPGTLVGPLINQRQLDHARERIADARSTNLRELVGGEPRGLVLPPHVFADVPRDHRLVREELFAPIAPILRAHGEEDALRLANDTEFGLSAAVFTRDAERGARFARRLESGMAHVNDQPVNDLANNPFGGEKNSGIGRFGGEWAIRAFTTDQWVTVQHQRRPWPVDQRAVGPWGGG